MSNIALAQIGRQFDGVKICKLNDREMAIVEMLIGIDVLYLDRDTNKLRLIRRA